MEKAQQQKKTVRAGDPVLVRLFGQWRRAFVAEACEGGVWIAPRDGSSGTGGVSRYGYRRTATAATAIAHFYALDSDQWRRDTRYWGRADAERRARREDDRQRMLNGPRFAFCRGSNSRPSHRNGFGAKPAQKKLPKYLEAASRPSYVAASSSYTASSSVGYGGGGVNPVLMRNPVAASSRGSGGGGGVRHRAPKERPVRAVVAIAEPSAEERAALQRREEELDAQHRARLAARLQRTLGRSRQATGELAQAFESLAARRERELEALREAGVRRAFERKVREFGSVEAMRRAGGAAAELLSSMERAQRRREAEEAQRMLDQGFADTVTVVKAGKTAVLFDRVAGRATLLRGPVSIRLALTECLLPEEQAALLLEDLEEEQREDDDIGDLALPTCCDTFDVLELPVRAVPVHEDQLTALAFDPIMPGDLVEDLRVESAVRVGRPMGNLVGLDCAEIDRQLHELDELLSAGFILEEEHASRSAELLDLRDSSWCLSQDQKVGRVALPQHVEEEEEEQQVAIEEEEEEEDFHPRSTVSWAESVRSTPSTVSARTPREPQVPRGRQEQQQQQQAFFLPCLHPQLPIGATAEDVRVELSRLETLRDSGFVLETEYSRRKQALVELASRL